MLPGRRSGRVTAAGRRGDRPLARAEDLARELVRSLHPELAARAVLLPRAPSDIVTANRTTVADGDRVIPLATLAGRAFPDPAEQAKLQALSDAIDAATGFDDADHAALAYTTDPRAYRRAELDAAQRELLRALLGTYLDRVPDGVSPLPATTTRRRWTPCTSPGPAPTEPGEPHYYRLQGPQLLIEWDNTQAANHAHAVWRDPERRLRRSTCWPPTAPPITPDPPRC